MTFVAIGAFRINTSTDFLFPIYVVVLFLQGYVSNSLFKSVTNYSVCGFVSWYLNLFESTNLVQFFMSVVRLMLINIVCPQEIHQDCSNRLFQISLLQCDSVLKSYMQ